MTFLFRALILAFGFVAAGCAVSQTSTANGAPLARQVAQSAHCGLVAPGSLVVSGPEDIERLRGLSDRALPLQLLRQINYQRERVVLASIGRKSTGGYSVVLQASELVDDVLRLTVRVIEPEPDAVVSQVLTTPCAVIAVTADGWKDIELVYSENNR